jgi:hypothetical protein
MYSNPSVTELCPCGSGLKRAVVCFDCLQAATQCSSCFLLSHQHNPLHWAHLWDPIEGYFRKRDYASVLTGTNHFIQLGHGGNPSKCKGGATPILFTIVHTNGIHGTRVRFCTCPGVAGKVEQLLKARLFPATTTDPKTAFSFDVLHAFQLHNMQTKCSSFDYILTLRRLTDDTFTTSVPVSHNELNLTMVFRS